MFQIQNNWRKQLQVSGLQQESLSEQAKDSIAQYNQQEQEYNVKLAAYTEAKATAERLFQEMIKMRSSILSADMRITHEINRFKHEKERPTPPTPRTSGEKTGKGN